MSNLCTIGNQLFGCGASAYLGIGDSQTFSPTYSYVEITALRGIPIIKMASTNHTCAITEDGRLYCWGRNDYMQCNLSSAKLVNVPVQVKLPYRVTDVAVGWVFTILCAGMNTNKQRAKIQRGETVWHWTSTLLSTEFKN